MARLVLLERLVLQDQQGLQAQQGPDQLALLGLQVQQVLVGH